MKGNFSGWPQVVDGVSRPKISGGRRATAQRVRPNLVQFARVVAFRDSMLLLVLAGVWAFFDFTTGGTFLTQRNLVLLALQTSIVSLAAISAVMLIVTRNFDLSVGSAVAFVGVILALLTVKYDVKSLDQRRGCHRRRRCNGNLARAMGRSNSASRLSS